MSVKEKWHIIGNTRGRCLVNGECRKSIYCLHNVGSTLVIDA